MKHFTKKQSHYSFFAQCKKIWAIETLSASAKSRAARSPKRPKKHNRLKKTSVLPNRRSVLSMLQAANAFYNSNCEAVMLLDKDGFLDCNDAALTLFGCATREEFCTYHPANLSPPKQFCGTDSITLANQYIATVIEKGSLRFEWIHKRLDAPNPFFAEVLLNILVLKGKKIIHATVHDITERKLAEYALYTAKKNAEMALNQLKLTQESLIQTQKMAALGGLVAGVAHEINTPTGIMLTSATHFKAKTDHVAKLYEDGELDNAQLQAYFKLAQTSSQLIATNCQRVAALVQSFKRVSVDQTSGERCEFEVKHYIEDVLLSLQPALKNTAIHIELVCPEGLIVDSYPGAISQILTNFIMNSLRHAYELHQTGVLSIRVTLLDHDRIELVYADDGKGISEENQSKIFEPFFTTQRATGGSGLGLHIVHNLVHHTLKGNLTLRSTENGTTFTVQFPRITP